MKFKKIIILMIIVIALICIFFISKNNIKAENSKEIVEEATSEEIEEEPIEWHGNYIWDGTNDKNSWVCFRKKVNLKEKDIKHVKAQIAVDSKYWLYINGEMVVREGALKRGEKRKSIYYDNVDITDYLHKGENTIAILVWYWGDIGYSHNSSGQAAMLFQAKIGNNYLVSNETWKVSRHNAYLQDDLRPNYRIVEYNVCYDAGLGDEQWYKPEYDDSLWADSTVLNVAGSLPWGEMIERDIPQFKNDELKEYENMSDYKDYITTKTETVEMIIPHNAQFTPYLEIDAPEDAKIIITTDQYEDVSGDSVRCTYIAKEGKQEFESLAWMNGEKVYYEMPEGVKIISLGYRETGYDTEMTGSFKCDNEFYNKLWKMAARTLYVNMRDTYMDCPNRERAQWWGDTSMEMLQAMYALDTDSYALYEKAVKIAIGWKVGNVFLTVAPIEGDVLYLPVQSLAAVNSMYEYYQYTGKTELLEYVYPHVKDFLNLWHVNEQTGLVDGDILEYPPVWEWGDSVAKCDYKAIENAWYYLALSKTAQMAEILGYQEDKADFDIRLENLKTNYNKLWTESGYKTANSKMIDERANALAVISGLADEEKYDTITNILVTSYDSTVYMEKYALQALCEMGKIEEAQKRIEYRYDEMVNGEKACSTLWENWDYEVGTKNHAWAGGPLIIMSKYFAGIEPLESGYETILVKPQFGKLSKISNHVTTVKGDINFEAEKTENSVNMKLNLPAKSRIAVPKIYGNMQISVNNKKVYQDGNAQKNKIVTYHSEDDKYIYFDVEKGKYEFNGIVE